MNTLTEHLMLERDAPTRMSDDVPADGLFVVIDGSPTDAEEFADRLAICTCTDGKCHRRDRFDRMFKTDDEKHAQHMATFHHGHVVPVRLYAVVGEVIA
jgi:hypothetical protein